MPELPEVETTLRGIEPHLLGRRITRVIVRDSRLRWPVPAEVSKAEGQSFVSLERRGKYLLLKLQQGGLIIHLGMSGSLRILQQAVDPKKHDHVDIELESGACLRFNDPRRVGGFFLVVGVIQ
jgi:formamidopyrimidine-DNA glycosylase